eukprot:TRINITY_DN4512_c1_g1_i1.p1 TRINITY_DN4512_c1_g1~~TRINITY_DN4512_c1_g1_i1.p1  ORF type:complete len:625 (+),score=237.99 TRINITY_DN4512_c1_g1_i1:65-1876(+)
MSSSGEEAAAPAPAPGAKRKRVRRVVRTVQVVKRRRKEAPKAPPPAQDGDTLLPGGRVRPDYLLCLDFEATCDNAGAVAREDMELIEFAWGMVNVREGRVCREGQRYIRPQYSKVTDFCTRLTGISAETVESGCGLAEAITDCAEYIESLPAGTRVAAVTHGTWDLGDQLRREAERKGIALPEVLCSAFDLRDEVVRWAGGAAVPDQTLRGLCRAVGIQRVGTNHSGLDDALTVAAVCCALLDNTGGRLHPDVDVLCSAGLLDFKSPFAEFAAGEGTAVRVKGPPLPIPHRQLQEQAAEWAAAAQCEQPIKAAAALLPRHPGAYANEVVIIAASHADARRLLAHRGVWGPRGRWVEVYPATAQQAAHAEGAAAAARAADARQEAAAALAARQHAARERAAAAASVPAGPGRTAATESLRELQGAARRMRERRNDEGPVEGIDDEAVQWPDSGTTVLSFSAVPRDAFVKGRRDVPQLLRGRMAKAAGRAARVAAAAPPQPEPEENPDYAAGLGAELLAQVEAFAEAWAPRSQLVLDSALSGFQRKLLHQWADEHGLGHNSRGVGAKRRLRLFVPNVAPAEPPADAPAAAAAAAAGLSCAACAVP